MQKNAPAAFRVSWFPAFLSDFGDPRLPSGRKCAMLRGGMPLRILFVLFSLVLLASGVSSLEQNFTCPVCGTEWTQRVETSAKPNGLRLDLRQLGDVVDPPTLPQCPKCRFTLFSDRLTDANLKKVKPFVRGADYQFLSSKSPSYFCLAQIQQILKAPPRVIGQSYLRAAWQVEGKPELAAIYLASAEEAFATALRIMDRKDKAFVDTALLRGELLRRLGRFPEAAAYFRDLAARPEFQDAQRKPILEQQMNLIQRQDDQPRQLGEAGALAPEPEMLPDPEPISIAKTPILESK